MSSQAPSQQVVTAIAREEGVPTETVSPPLYEAIDPDALNALFARDDRTSSRPIEVGFEYAGYDVHVIGTGVDSVAVNVHAPGAAVGARAARSIHPED